MKILLINKFLFPKGGSETVLFDTAALLAARGHRLSFMAMEHPRNVVPAWPTVLVSQVLLEGKPSPAEAFKAAGRVLFSFEARRRLEKFIRDEKPDLAHLHNIHHQISPSILPVLKDHGIPVVMTLHDLKMACPVYTCVSHGRICESCRGRRFYFCLAKSCNQNSYAKSALSALEMFIHHVLLRIYRHVDYFIAPSEFLKLKLEDMGFRAPMVCLPHFLDTADFTPSFEAEEPSFIYFGRLARVKGIQTLIKAARGLPLKGKIVGDGELKEDVMRAVQAPGYSGLILKPHLSRGELIAEVRTSSCAVLPSEWYENCPLSVIEAFALGKPVIGARIGGIPELVRDGETGLLFEPGNARDLGEKLMTLAGNPGLAAEMGKRARRGVEERLNPDVYYSKLMEIYGKAQQRCS